MALASLTLEGPIVGSDISKDSAIVSWLQIPFDSIRESKELTVVLYDQEQKIDYQKYPRKQMFRIEINIFREEIHADRKKFVNLVELLSYVIIFFVFLVLYRPFVSQFFDFLKQKDSDVAQEEYNYPYFITHISCMLKITSVLFYCIQGVYNYIYPLSSSYTKHHLISFAHFIGCLFSHTSGYLFTLLLIFIANGYTLTYVTQHQAV
jgi:hypothetical protein